MIPINRHALAAIGTCLLAALVILLGSSKMALCGRSSESPELSLGLSPAWFNGKFTFLKGTKLITSSRAGDTPVYDDSIKGAELFRTITAYGAGNEGDYVLFKATTWAGEEETFVLREHSPQNGESHVFEISAASSTTDETEWTPVDKASCLAGVYSYIYYGALIALAVIGLFLTLAAVSSPTPARARE